jgi:hypothetical protein
VSSSFELWFPAVIRLQNPDGKYQIEYSTKIWMSWILLPPKRCLSGSKPYTVATVILTKLVMITMKTRVTRMLITTRTAMTINRKYRSSFHFSNVAMVMPGRSREISEFPARRGSLYHPVRSRVRVDTTVVVRPLMTGVIRQIIQDPENKERYSVEARVSSVLRGIWGDQFHY